MHTHIMGTILGERDPEIVFAQLTGEAFHGQLRIDRVLKMQMPYSAPTTVCCILSPWPMEEHQGFLRVLFHALRSSPHAPYGSMICQCTC
jgi:hypothetical protein